LAGNHDYWGIPFLSRRHLAHRFENLRKGTYGQVRYGNSCVLYLDSNEAVLGSAGWNLQLAWFHDTLKTIEADSSIKHFAVFSHHPPFTNSRHYRGKKDFQKHWVPAFLRHPKGSVWVSGHVHSYEHFETDGKHFIVMGSSGGPRVPLRSGNRAKFIDQFQYEGLRPFVWAEITAQDSVITIEIHGFKKENPEPKMIDRILIETLESAPPA
jgi:hypothetical protein